MSLIAQIKEKLELWFELAEKRKTAAEKVTGTDIQFLHRALTELEGKVVIITDETAAKVRALVSELKRDLTADETKAVTEFDGAIKYVKDLVAAKAAAPAPVAVPTPPPAPPETPAPAETAPAAPAAPVVDVTAATPPATS